MSATPSDPKTTPAGQPVADPGLTFGDNLQQLWTKHSNLITTVCVVILLGILGKGGWDFYQAQREAGIESNYAAATTPDKLKAFASANAGHTLAGVAALQLADGDYAAGRYAEAQAGYDQAVATLKTGPFAARAQLGSAMAKLGAGKTSEGGSRAETNLKRRRPAEGHPRRSHLSPGVARHGRPAAPMTSRNFPTSSCRSTRRVRGRSARCNCARRCRSRRPRRSPPR